MVYANKEKDNSLILEIENKANLFKVEECVKEICKFYEYEFINKQNEYEYICYVIKTDKTTNKKEIELFLEY